MDHTSTILDLPLFDAESADVGGPLDALMNAGKTGRYVNFALGGKRFCIASAAIAEITGPLTSTFLPNSPPHVAGLAPFRGEALAMINLRELLQADDADSSSRPKSLVLRDRGMATRIAFEIDRMLNVVDNCDGEFNMIGSSGVVDAVITSPDGQTCSRIDAVRLYSLLNT